MSDARHPYAGRRAVLTTMHGKEAAIAPAMLSQLGLIISPTVGLDTDQLGTFSGEIPRDGTMLSVAVRKARLGMSAAGASLGLASEGSFGPHPGIPFIPAGIELLVFIDDDSGMVVHEGFIAEATNFDHLAVSPGDTLESFLGRIGFPTHGVIVRPNDDQSTAALTKGIVKWDHLTRAIAEAAAASRDGRARLETDMRAHFNPTRMQSLATLADRLARRLATLCPNCGSPGFGQTDTRAGLPCGTCGTPTEMIAAAVFGCPACDHTQERPRSDGLQRAPAQDCSECNP